MTRQSRWGWRILVVVGLGVAVGASGPLGFMLAGLLLWLIPISLVIWWGSEVLGSLRRIETQMARLASAREREDAQ